MHRDDASHADIRYQYLRCFVTWDEPQTDLPVKMHQYGWGDITNGYLKRGPGGLSAEMLYEEASNQACSDDYDDEPRALKPAAFQQGAAAPENPSRDAFFHP